MSTALVKRADVPTFMEADLKSSRKWLVDVALYVLEGANKYSAAAGKMLDQVAMLTACANLPGDMPIRVRCTPRVFTFKA